MDSLVGYGSDDDIDSDRHGPQSSVGASGRRREDDTNYDDVNMDMSDDSQGESEPELPPADARGSRQSSREDRRSSNDSRERDRDRGHDGPRDGDRDRDRERDRERERDRDRERDRESNRERIDNARDRRREHDRKSPRREDRSARSERPDRSRGHHDSYGRRGLLGDKPDDRPTENKVPALMELKPYGGEAPSWVRSQDARDAVSPRFVDRDRRDRDRERGRERDRDNRHSRRSEERRRESSRERRSRPRSRSRGAAFPPPHHSSTDRDRRSSPSGDYRPSSYKVNKKLEVMEKMGLQIKTPDGSMATAQQLRAAAGDAPPSRLPACAPAARVLEQVQKRKLLWANKNKSVEAEAAKWTGTKFAQDSDGKQVSKFMRLMGIKDAAVAEAAERSGDSDPNKKQEELFQAMQAQYDVARATTHTMRGVGLGFSRQHF